MSDDEAPQLSAETLAALREFYSEQKRRDETAIETEPVKIDRPFDENWQLSQFWYDDRTINAIIKVICKIAVGGESICLISCPTLYPPLKRSLPSDTEVRLLEFDRRFKIYGEDFLFYDFNNPLDVPEDARAKYDIVIADPPFLSEECLTKTSRTIGLLAKDKIVLCTGSIMRELAAKLLNLSMCDFAPRHKNNLANEFSCYTNFDFDQLLTTD